MTWLASFGHWLATPFRALMNVEGIKAWAVVLLAGAGIAMTVYAGFAMFLVRDDPKLAFYLGVGALLLLGIIITGYAGLIVKRDVDLKALGLQLRISDQEKQEIAAAVVAATPPAPPVVIQTGASEPKGLGE